MGKPAEPGCKLELSGVTPQQARRQGAQEKGKGGEAREKSQPAIGALRC